MNIIRKYKLTEEEKRALDTVGEILFALVFEDYDHFDENILKDCSFEVFYNDYTKIYRELTKEEN